MPLGRAAESTRSVSIKRPWLILIPKHPKSSPHPRMLSSLLTETCVWCLQQNHWDVEPRFIHLDLKTGRFEARRFLCIQILTYTDHDQAFSRAFKHRAAGETHASDPSRPVGSDDSHPWRGESLRKSCRETRRGRCRKKQADFGTCFRKTPCQCPESPVCFRA